MSIKVSYCLIQAYCGDQFHKYVYEDKKGNLILGTKNNRNGKRIHFDDLITILEKDSQTLDVAQKKQLVSVVKKMSERKFLNAFGGNCINRIVGVFRKFVSCFQNFYNGFGFQTSCNRADTLVKVLEKALSAESKKSDSKNDESIKTESKPKTERPIRSLNPSPDHAFAGRSCARRKYNDLEPLFLGNRYPESAESFYDAYAKEYSSLNKNNVFMLSAAFTYLGAHLYYKPIPVGSEALYNAKALWAGSWRAVINQLENMREFLFSRHHIQPMEDNPEIGMHHIQNLSGLKAGARLTPADSAELFFRYVQASCFSEDDQKKIFELFEPKGFLFLNKTEDSPNKISYEDWLKKNIAHHVSHIVSKEREDKPVFRLSHLAEHFWNISISDLIDISKNGSKDSVLTAHWVKFNDLFGKTYIYENEKVTAWIAYLALVKLFPEEDCQNTQNIDAAKFPKLDDEKNPIPLMIDDSYAARNLYAYHVKDKKVKDVFIGETNVGILSVSQNPWTACGWMNAAQITIDEGQLMVLGLMSNNTM